MRCVVAVIVASAMCTCSAQEEIYRDLVSKIDARQLQTSVRVLSASQRLSGLSKKQQDYIYGPNGLGVVGSVSSEDFEITIPDPNARATITTPGGKFPLMPIWPNGVRTSTCDVTGKLLYVGDGLIERFDGKEVSGSIVLMDFESGQRWHTAARLGAKAVIFIGTEQPTRSEADAKWSEIPLSVPRFWSSKVDGIRLLRHIGSDVRLTSEQNWITVPANNHYVALRGADPKMRDEWIVISAYSDSVCAVPGVSFGADQAAGAAALLELAKLFQAQKPKRSVLFQLTAGHFQAMQGMRAFMERRFQKGWDITDGHTPQAFFCLDLSTRSTSIASVAKGWWFDYRDENIEGERSIARALRDHAGGISRVLREQENAIYFDAVNNPDGRDWRNSVPGKFASEAEIVNMAGINAIGFFTSGDARIFQDTPADTFENVNVGNLTTQVRTLACILYHALNDTQDERRTREDVVPYRGAGSLSRMSLTGGFGTITGNVLRFDPVKSFVPDVPVPGALVQHSNRYKTYLGVRGAQFVRAEGLQAKFAIYGVPPITAWPESQRTPVGVFGFVLAPNGEITHTLDFGIQGASQYETLFQMTTSHRQTPVVVFPCSALELYGLVDPHRLKALTYFDVLDARNDGRPARFSFYASFQSDWRLQSFVEDSAVVFAPAGTRVKVLAASTMAFGLFLTNADAEHPAGEGFELASDSSVVPHVALQSARDIWQINSWREAVFRRHHIENAGVARLQKSAAEEIRLAEDAYARQSYSEGDRHSRAAWGFALRAHPELKNTAADIVHGLILYLALLLPFSFFAERLLFNARLLSVQLLLSGGIFAICFLLLRYLHPAFDITGNTFMIFVAFTIGALSLIVMTFVIGKFEGGLHKLQQEASGVHEEAAAKLGMAATAMSIGISNLRRRRVRTALTSATLILVSFIIMSFTGVVTELRFNEVPAAGKPSYSGMLLREVTFDPLEESAFRSLRTEYGGTAAIARRAWFYGAVIGSQSVLAVRHKDRLFEATALMGMDPAEAKITAPQNTLVAGRWLTEADKYVAILPRSVADRLAARIGSDISFGGINLAVVGIADDAQLKAISDLDNESILPADFGQSKLLQDRGLGGDYAFRKYIRYDPSTVIVVPASLAIDLGADLRTIAVSFNDYGDTRKALDNLMPRTSLNIYASVMGSDGPEIRKFSTVAAAKSRGIELVILPVLLACIIVLNTMVSSVLERTREIGIFSAVGLSPKNIASLFFAESAVYAIIGAVLGYFLAQTVGLLVGGSGAFAGLSLNYTSLSALIATGLVVALVLTSTIYPARIARKLATPAGGEDWHAESPKGDEWQVVLPFTVTHRHASALSHFYAEWLSAYENYSIGEFVTESVSSDSYGDRYFASARCWLAPFDLGVQQNLRIEFVPTEMQDVYAISLHLERISGDPEHWESLNRRFLRSLRRQFLIWRTLTPAQKQVYMSL